MFAYQIQRWFNCHTIEPNELTQLLFAEYYDELGICGSSLCELCNSNLKQSFRTNPISVSTRRMIYDAK